MIYYLHIMTLCLLSLERLLGGHHRVAQHQLLAAGAHLAPAALLGACAWLVEAPERLATGAEPFKELFLTYMSSILDTYIIYINNI